ncbi:MAG: alpha/beta hydrolase [Actinobacteria bacterium]|nr:alpha/beta hydrolase [Actinomycetota bacterium]
MGDEEHAEVGGVGMRWLGWGADGPPVVLIHGIPTTPELWRHVAPAIPDVRVLAWEMVGYGRSWRAGKGLDISLRAQAGHLARWLEHLGLRRPVLVGHDLGGGVAQIVAVQRPELVGGLVLTNAVAYDSWPIPSVRAMRACGPLLARTPVSVFRRVLSSFLRQGHDDPQCASESIDVHWHAYNHAEGPRAFLRQIRSLNTRDTADLAAQLPSLDVPAAIVWGAADRFQKLTYGQRLARDLRAPIDEVDAGKHFVPEDHPDRVASAIGEVLRRAA